MKQRILSMITVLTLCLTLLPTAVFAEELPIGTINIADGDIVITGEGYTVGDQSYIYTGDITINGNSTATGNVITVNDNRTIKLDNVLIGKDGAPTNNRTPLTIEAGKTVTLNLEGDVVLGDGWDAYHATNIVLGNGASLTIQGSGTLKCTENLSYSKISLGDDASVTVEGGTVNLRTSYGHCPVTGSGIFAVNGGYVKLRCDGGSGIIFGGDVDVSLNGGLMEVYDNAKRFGGKSFEMSSGTLLCSVSIGLDKDLAMDGGTLKIGSGQTLTIAEGKTLTIGQNATLTNEGTLINGGTLTVASGGTLNIQGHAENAGSGQLVVEDGGTVHKKAQPTPPAPTVASATDTTITLNAVTPGVNGVEYKAAGSFQISPEFTNLSSETTHGCMIKYPGNDYYNDSFSSEAYFRTAPAAGRGYAIEYTNETLTIDSGYEVNTQADFEGDEIVSGQRIRPGSDSTTFYIRKAESSTNPASAAQILTIPARPAAPTGLAGHNTSFYGEHDGYITGVSEAMEYKRASGGGNSSSSSSSSSSSGSSSGSWRSCIGDSITGLSAGTYDVRVKATDSSFVGLSTSVTISSGDERTYTLNVTAPSFDTVEYRYNQPAAKSITISSSGNSDATISSVALSGADAFVLNKTDGSTITAGGTDSITYTIQPKAGLDVGTYTVTITVTYDDEAVATATLTFSVTEPTTYTVTVTNGGTGTSGSGTYAAGETVTISAGTKSNYRFNGWTSSDGVVFADASSATTTFTMPGKEVTVTANWIYLGGGGGGGSSSGNTTTTTKNPDGSTTTTVANKNTGVVTETTKMPDGTTGTIVTDKNGTVTEVEASVSNKAVKDAAKTGEAVTLPVEVPASTNSKDAPAVEVTLPKNSGSVKVEIPVEKVTPGTVVIIVKADGTEEVVRTSVPTANGVELTMVSSATVKVVDKSRDFIDVPATHTFNSVIDFASARGIVEGYGNNTFNPAGLTTSAAGVTVVARIIGENLYGSGSTVKAQDWAKTNGIAEGLDLSGNVTRSAFMVMLWRAASCPEASDDALAFTDVDTLNAVERAAFAWAVENGIIGGYADGTVRPYAGITRGAMAAIAERYMTR